VSASLETSTGDRVPIWGNCSLGRDPKNTIVLPGNQVSRRHALVHMQGGEHWLVDLGSSNGTVLNGRRVKQPMQLKDEDKIEIGPNALIFRAGPKEEQRGAILPETTNYVTIKAVKTENLWLLIADIEKFTPLSQKLPGDQLAKLVGKWIASCKEIIEKYDGTINKYLGDGFLVYWPSPDTAPENVFKTITELKVIQAAKDLPFRLVIHYGSITVDNSLSEGEDSLIGPEVNFVFRMEKVAGALEQHCVISEAAAQHLKQFSAATPQGEHTLTGFNGTHKLYSF